MIALNLDLLKLLKRRKTFDKKDIYAFKVLTKTIREDEYEKLVKIHQELLQKCNNQENLVNQFGENKEFNFKQLLIYIIL